MDEGAQTALWQVRGMVASQKPEDREKTEAAAQELRQVIAKYPDGHGLLALTLLVVEAQAGG